MNAWVNQSHLEKNVNSAIVGDELLKSVLFSSLMSVEITDVRIFCMLYPVHFCEKDGEVPNCDG